MSRPVIIGITLLVLISVTLLCGSVALYITKESEIEKRMLLEKQLKEMTRIKEMIGIELAALKEAKAQMELKLALKEKELMYLQEKFDLFRMERGMFENEKSTITEELVSLKKDFQGLRGDFEQLQQAKEVLEQKLKDALSSGIQLKTIVVESDKEVEEVKEVKKTVEGEILAVNKEYEFFVISLGLKDGLTEDSKISVYIGSELVAIGEIEKLYENISAVVVYDLEQFDKIKAGDKVVVTIGKPS